MFLDFPMALTCHHVLMHVVFHKDVFSLGHLKVDAALCRYAPGLAHWSIDKVWRKGRAIIALIAAVCTFFFSINLFDPESNLCLKIFMYVFLGFTNYKSKYLHSSQCIGCMHAVAVVQLGDYSAMPEKDL